METLGKYRSDIYFVKIQVLRREEGDAMTGETLIGLHIVADKR
jgi:hypothetical protein